MNGDERMPHAQVPGHVPAPAPGPDPAPAPAPARDAAAEGRPPRAVASVEPPSPEVALAQEASPLPGAHRGGFQRLPTGPVGVTVQWAPAEPGADAARDQAAWSSTDPGPLQRGLGVWALGFAIVGLVVSLVVGWGFPIGIVAIVSAILALRRPLESRAVAVWALVLGAVSIVYSAGWLLYAASRADLIG
jgi:hypothetical protein